MSVSPANMRGGDDTSFDLRDLIEFLWRKKFRIIFLAGTLFVLGAYYVVNLPKIYTAESTILLSEGSSSLSIPTSLASFTGEDYSKMDTFIEFMRSRQFARLVVENLDLIHAQEYRLDNAMGKTQEEATDHAINVLLGSLSISAVGETDMLRIRVDSLYPNLAAEIANHIGPAFFAFYSSMSQQRAGQASELLNEQLQVVQNNLINAESELQVYLQDNQLIDINSQYELAVREISMLQQEKFLVEKRLSDKDSTLRLINQAADNPEGLMQVPWILQNPLITDIRSKIDEHERKFAELKLRYKEKHHRYIAMASQLDTLYERRDQLLLKLTNSLRQEVSSTETRLDVLNQQIEAARSEHSELGKQQIQFSKLQRQVQSTQNLYEVFLERLQETELLKDLDNQEEFAVVDYAVEPAFPSKPRVTMMLFLLMVMSGIFSAGLWLLIHLVSDRRTRFQQLLKTLNIPVLGEIPRLPSTKKAKNMDEFLELCDKDITYTESIRSLRSSLLVRRGDTELRKIALTQTHEGASQHLSLSLAYAFGKLEKSLLMDANLRNSSLNKVVGIDADSQGLTDFINRRTGFSRCLTRHQNSQLFVMPGGREIADPLIYLSKPRFASFLAKLGVFYDRLIIQTPSITGYSDPLVVSKLVDGMVLVCDIDRTTVAQLVESVQKLDDAGVELLGVVFENVKHVKSKLRQPGIVGFVMRRLRLA